MTDTSMIPNDQPHHGAFVKRTTTDQRLVIPATLTSIELLLSTASSNRSTNPPKKLLGKTKFVVWWY